MFQMSDGYMNFADGDAMSREDQAFAALESQERTKETLTHAGLTVGSGAFWGWYSAFRGGALPELIAGTGLTLDAVVGVGLHVVNMLGYGGQYESWLTDVANGSLTHFAIKWAEGLGTRMAADSGTGGGYQYGG